MATLKLLSLSGRFSVMRTMPPLRSNRMFSKFISAPRVSAVGVEVEDHPIGDRERLAAQHEAARDLVVFERVVGVHLDLALDHFAAAGRANAALARVAHVDAVFDAGVEHRLGVLVHREAALAAVDDDSDLA